MDSLACNTTKKEAIKVKLIEFMEQNDIEYNLNDCCGSDKFCVDLCSEEKACKRCCCQSEIIVKTSNKDICKIYPYEILYIAIEDRKSVLYLVNERLETNYLLEHWKDVLNPKVFAQPHHSFIVNLKHVSKITKDFVYLKYGNEECSVYTSYRRIGKFKKAFLEFNKL